MSSKNRISLALVCLVLSLFLSGCGGDNGTSSATLTVLLSAACAPTVSTVEVFIDSTSVGTIVPGASVGRSVTVGDHTVSARANTGTTWGPFLKTVTEGGVTATLTCG